MYYNAVMVGTNVLIDDVVLQDGKYISQIRNCEILNQEHIATTEVQAVELLISRIKLQIAKFEHDIKTIKDVAVTGKARYMLVQYKKYLATCNVELARLV